MIAAGAPASRGDELWAGGGWHLDDDVTVQLLGQRGEVYAPLGGGTVWQESVDLRWNFQLACDSDACGGTRFVFKPRPSLTEFQDKPNLLPSENPDGVLEGYAIVPVGDGEIGVGKRLIGWGPSLLYSPTNRLFPDNGAFTPRLEIPGKPMVFASAPIFGEGRLNLLVADPTVENVPGLRGDRAFALARAEWNWVTEPTATVGAVIGGGGSYKPYGGAYIQYGLYDAWTLGAEFSTSRGYASTVTEGQPPLAQDHTNLKWDGTLNLRYGLSSGAEIGFELIGNGYALNQQELANPFIAALPTLVDRAVHPFGQSALALLQTTWPKLFDDQRWGLTTRALEGLDRSSTDLFGELSFSPTDDATVYAGISRSWVRQDLLLTRPLPLSAYLAVEIHF